MATPTPKTRSGVVEYICIPHNSIANECIELTIRWLELSQKYTIHTTTSTKIDVRVRGALYCHDLKMHEAEVSTSFSQGMLIGQQHEGGVGAGMNVNEYDGAKDIDEAFQWRYDWGAGDQQVLSFPVIMKDLSRDASVLLQVVKSSDEVLYTSKLELFDMHGKLKHGLQKVSLLTNNNNHNKMNQDEKWKATLVVEELGQKEGRDWLDDLTLQACRNVVSGSFGVDESFLVVDLPTFPVPIVWEEVRVIDSNRIVYVIFMFNFV